MPRVTVLTSVYNGEPYIDRAVPSILNQTYKDFEFLIVDDGSTDGTGAFLDELEKKDSRVRVIRNGRMGFAKALNYALAQAQGEYIVRQDFDDVSYPERIEQQVEFLDNHPEVGLVGTWYVLEDYNRDERYIRKWPTDHKAIKRTMAKAIPFAHTQVALRKEALVDAGGIADVKNITDLRTWISVGKLGWKFANIPEVLGVHYVYKDSFWHQNFKYHKRQRELAFVQAQAVIGLRMGIWRMIFPLSRIFYSYMPTGMKKFIRRAVTGSREEDLPLEKKED
ncbi:MAG: glycosyltransferase family 2 protein [Spirochaetales bacterium]|nr:glycosyltransferase family 2 protein [Spirochaetales bacterium]